MYNVYYIADSFVSAVFANATLSQTKPNTIV